MKRFSQILVPVLFTLGYTAFFSLGMASLFLAFGYGMAISLDGPTYPRFVPFCLAVCLCCVVAFICLLFVNWLVAEKYSYRIKKWGLQLLIAFPISLALIHPWMMFLEFLHRIF